MATTFRAQLLRGLKKIFREYRDLPNNEQETFLDHVVENVLRAKIDQAQLRHFLALMKADRD